MQGTNGNKRIDWKAEDYMVWWMMNSDKLEQKKKDCWKLQEKDLSQESKDLILEIWFQKKDREKPKKGKRLTKLVLKNLLIHNTKWSNKQTLHQAKASQINLEKFENSYFSYN